MSAPATLVTRDGALTPLAIDVLHAFADVPVHLLHATRIRRASDNWLHAPWYRFQRGGAITIGHTIWLTRRYFDTRADGDGSLRATWHWLRILMHEVGHLPQAERFGLSLVGRMRYVMAFILQYGKRALLFQRAVHDDAPLEIEADRGRWTLLRCIGEAPLEHPLMQAIHNNDVRNVRTWLEANAVMIAAERARYRSGSVT